VEHGRGTRVAAHGRVVKPKKKHIYHLHFTSLLIKIKNLAGKSNEQKQEKETAKKE